MKKQTQEITASTTINSLLEKNPEFAEILMAYGLNCVGCHFSDFDTLEDGAMMHGLSDDDIKMMIKDLNNSASKKNLNNKDY